jgi:RHS repeat-associated protein
VRIDGVEVMGPSALDQQIGAATARIALMPTSTIEVSIADSGALRLEVVDEGQTCSILSPSDVYQAGFKVNVATTNAFPAPELQLFNGGLDGTARTNKGEVRLDGALLVSRQDIHEKVSAVFAPAPLPGVLTAQAGEKGYFTLELVDRDETAPVFTIDSPADLLFTNQRQLTVSGSIDDPSARVTLNGATATVSGGYFTGQVQVGSCWNLIRVEASDACGNASAATVHVGLDTTPPVVGILIPANGAVSNHATEHVVIRYSDDFSGMDPSSVRITLDGADVTANLAVGPEQAEGDLTVTAGVHHLRVDLADRAANPASADSAFTIDLTPPTVSIVSPVSGILSNGATQHVLVQYSDDLSGVDPASVRITLDGADVTARLAVGPEQAQGDLSVAAGVHSLRVDLADRATNPASAQSTFTIDLTSPAVSIVSPANGLLSNRGTQHVLIQYSDDLAGVDLASVRIRLDGADVTGSLAVGPTFAEGDLPIAGGVHTLRVELADRATNPAPAASTFTIDLAPPVLAIVIPADGSQGNASPVSVMITYADAVSGVNASTLAISLDGQDVRSSFAAGPVSAGASIALAPGPHQLLVSIADLAGNPAQATATFDVKKIFTGPPDPAQVAPPNDLTVTTDIAASTAFLYTGENPVQTGVAQGTITPQRAAVIRGQVFGRDATPLAGARVTIIGHPEFGSTLTREDGMFDLAVNGGGALTVNLQKDGFLPAQRKVDVPWRDFVWAPLVALVPFDTVTAELRAGAATMQVARGSQVTDSDGTRQATVLLPSGTAAWMSLPDGSTSPLGTFHVRATEYTVGATGGMAMPGELPPTTGYTYAVELSVDEAVIAGAGRVSFSQPVPVYLENFLGVAVGLAVPAGYYDRTAAVWIPTDDGRVIKVLSTAGGTAAIDTNGDGIAEDPATLTSIGITLEERQQLAALYAPGQTLWRVPVPHFSAFDFNGGFGCEADSDGNACPQPNAPPPGFGGSGTPCPTITGGSIIDCENQGLGEDVKITGTDLSLSYRSLRQLGRKAERTITVHLPTKISSKGLGIVYEVYVAGQRLTQRTTSLSANDVTYVWDGRDAYKRPVQGAAPVLARIGVIYHPVLSFAAVASGGRSFASMAPFSHGSTAGIYSRYDNCSGPCQVPDGASVGSEFVAWTTWQGTLSSFTELPKGLGGWSLSNVHQYDPVAKVVYRGDGEIQGATPLDSHVISTYGTVGWPVGMAIAPDGTVYTSNGGAVNKIDSTGKVTQIAGGGPNTAPQSEIPATQAYLNTVYDLAVGPDGSLYLGGNATAYAGAVRKITPDGMIHDFAGAPYSGYGPQPPVGDWGPARAARVGFATGVAAGRDGSVFIMADDRVRKVTPDGIIQPFAGTGAPCWQNWGGYSTCCYSGDGGRAADAQICGGGNYGKLAVGPDGSVYLAQPGFDVVRRVRPDGTIVKFAGSGHGFGGDGGSALLASFSQLEGVSVGPDGSVYIADSGNGRIRRVSPTGTIETVAGKGYGSSGDGGPATAAQLATPWAAGVGPSGELFIADSWNHRARKVGAPFPGFTLAEFTVPSRDGSELYVFSSSGQHLRTLDPRTKAAVFTFGYDGTGRLATISDRAGLMTTIERAGDKPVAIVSPYGVRTSLATDANGYLSAITNPANESRSYTYDALGLMGTYTDPRKNVHTFSYDAVGRLFRDENPAGGSKTLTRTVRPDGFSVSIQTALGQTTVHDVRPLTGGEARTSTQADGSVVARTELGTGVRSFTLPSGATVSTTFGADPQFAMQAAIPTASSVLTPSGLSLQGSSSATVMLQNPADPLSVISRADFRTVNGRTSTTTYTASSRTLVAQSAAGRTATATLDPKGRVTQVAMPGVYPVSLHYDTNGRLDWASQGSRSIAVGYDASGFVRTVTDPLSRTTTMLRDGAGRVVEQTLPGNRTVSFGYDASGNLTALAPPSRPAHGFAYTSIDQVQSYDPPTVAGSGSTSTGYSYDLDGELYGVLFPDAETLTATWERDANDRPTGRLASVTTGYGTTSLAYDPGGLVGTIAGPEVTLTYRRDGFLPTSEAWAGAVTGAVGYTYDSDFRVSGVRVGGATTSRSYDADGLLTGTGALGIARETATGRISTTTLGGVATSQTYDGYGALATFSARVSGAEQYRYELTPDALGRIASKKETIGGEVHTTSYGYDDAGRLWNVYRDGALSVTYEYDGNGNRTRKTSGSGVEEGSYDAQDRLLAYAGANYSWRPNGELESKTAAGQTTWYGYDRLGNLRQVGLPDGRSFEYLVDGRNRRVGKKVNGALIEGFLYEGQLRPVAWLDGSGAVKATFVYGTRVNVPEYMVTQSGTYRIVTDHLGSPRLVVDATSGAIVQRVDYDEWGQVLQDTNPGFQPFGFAGGLYDRDTGLVRFGARDYDPQTGRWTNKDPIAFRGGNANLYVYVNIDPINGADLNGLCTLSLGFSVTVSIWNIGFTAGVGVIVDGHGNVGVYGSSGMGFGGGLGGQAGVGVQVSNGDTIGDYGGLFANTTGFAGVGEGVSGDAFSGYGTQGQLITGGGVSYGVGIGGGGFGAVTNTTVIPLN